ncbi:MAG TPA: hypothetical protein VGI40_05045 [Pirellulaceae bacterium]|jgi:hypothetical protein
MAKPKTSSSVNRQPEASAAPVVACGCVDLRQIAGDCYRIDLDEAHTAERGSGCRAADAWLLVVPCRFGHVFPWGKVRLAVSTNGRGPTAQRLAGLPFVRVEQAADDGFTLSFAADRFDEIAAIVKPLRLAGRRAMSADERKRAVERLRPFRFEGRSTQNRGPKIERNSTQTASDDSRHLQAAPRAITAA